MNIVEVPIWLAGVMMLVMAWVAGYFQGKAEPSDAATLLVAGRMVDQPERAGYMSPGQMASILLPRATRWMKMASNLTKLGILAMAILTTWWLWFPAAFLRIVATVITERLWANWSLDYNCFWISADLDRRKAQFMLKRDEGRLEAADSLLESVNEIWEQAQEDDEIVPKRMEIAKRLGVRRSL